MQLEQATSNWTVNNSPSLVNIYQFTYHQLHQKYWPYVNYKCLACVSTSTDYLWSRHVWPLMVWSTLDVDLYQLKFVSWVFHVICSFVHFILFNTLVGLHIFRKPLPYNMYLLNPQIANHILILNKIWLQWVTLLTSYINYKHMAWLVQIGRVPPNIQPMCELEVYGLGEYFRCVDHIRTID